MVGLKGGGGGDLCLSDSWVTVMEGEELRHTLPSGPNRHLLFRAFTALMTRGVCAE